VVLISGTLGDHGMAIMAARENLGFETPIVSDSAALHGLTEALFASGARVHTLRDPTRGGLATTLNEIARQSGVGIVLDEAALPINPAVAAACEFLGLDPLYVANEGKLSPSSPPTTPMPRWRPACPPSARGRRASARSRPTRTASSR
jgi:hydrogenase expression/formation protein HypE